MHVLHKDLARALRDAAVNLAVEQQRVEDRPGVVDGGVAHQRDLAGVDVDFHLGDVHAIGKGGFGPRRCAEFAVLVQAGLHLPNGEAAILGR